MPSGIDRKTDPDRQESEDAGLTSRPPEMSAKRAFFPDYCGLNAITDSGIRSAHER